MRPACQSRRSTRAAASGLAGVGIGGNPEYNTHLVRRTRQVKPMVHVTYKVVRHEDGWAYTVDGVFSESFPTHEEALEAARHAAAEQRQPGRSETIEYEDEHGKWHTELALGTDRPETDVEDSA